MTDDLDRFSDRYRQRLEAHLSDAGEDSLHDAYELGREAQADGMGLLDLTWVHWGSFRSIVNESVLDRETLVKWFNASSKFLDEGLSPYEVSRLASQEATNAMRRLFDLLEQEAKRIAHLLHDESAQMLATVYLELAQIERDAPEGVAARVHQVVKHLDEVREQLRTLSHELRPPILDQLGLLPALQSLAEGVHRRTGLQVSIEGDTGGRLDQTVETLLYRVAQEGLMNIHKHARARSAWLHVWIEDGYVKCSIRDDGIGLPEDSERSRSFRGLGLVSINERVNALNGNCTINSTPGEGMELLVTIPL